MTVPAVALKSFLTEWYQPVLGDRGVDGIALALGEFAAGLHDEGQHVHVQLVVEVPTDEVLYAVFQAESRSAVVEVCNRSGWPVDRIIDVQSFAP